MSGFIYLIRSPALNAVKLGFTCGHPQRRLADLQTGNADGLVLLGWYAGTMVDERKWHMRFSDYRIRGEWFRLEGNFKKFVDAFLAHYWPTCPERSAA